MNKRVGFPVTRRAVILSSLMGILIFQGGCGGKPWFANWFKESNSLDSDGEKVTVQVFSSYDDIDTYAKTHISDATTQPSMPSERQNFLTYFDGLKAHPSQNPEIVLPVAVIIGAAVSFAVDQIQADLQKEATLYQAQFSGTCNQSGFWTSINSGLNQGYVPTLVGFAIRRNTKSYDGKTPGTDAYNLICLLTPSGNGGVFEVQPIYFKTNCAKAKVYQFGAKTIESKLNLSVSGTWIGSKDGSFHSESLGTAVLDVGGYDISRSQSMDNSQLTGTPTPIHPAGNSTANLFGQLGAVGYITGPPQPPNATDSGAITLTALVTETDQSQASAALQTVATFLQNNKSTIVQVSGGTNPSSGNPPTQPSHQ